MCRNIKQLYNFAPPASDDEIRDASVQFVRKVTGFRKPSQINEEAFNTAIADISAIVRDLFEQLETTATPKNREEELAKARARNAKRFSN